MPSPDEFQEATPREIAYAWFIGVMNGTDRAYVDNRFAAHPPPADLIDPTYTTPDGPDRAEVWHRARDIQSMSAQAKLKGYLHDRELTLPREVIDAWAVTNEHHQWAVEIRLEVESALTNNVAGARSKGELAELVLDALKEYRFTLGDLA